MPREYDPEAPLRAAGAGYMLTQCRKIAKHIPSARNGEDPEDLHDVRVGIPRLRTAMPVFRTCFAARQYQIWYGRLSELADALTDVRDMDVQIELVTGARDEMPPEHRAGINAWLARRAQHREEARTEMVAALDRWDSDGMSEALRRAIETTDDPARNLGRRSSEIEIALIDRLEEYAAMAAGEEANDV